jgi:D-arginine dehydrogenase
MDIDVNALHQGFLRGAKATGTNLVVGALVLTATYHGGKWTVVTQTGSFSAAVVVNGAGAWADEFAILCGALPVGLTPYRRTAMLVDVPRDVSIRHWPAVIDVDEEFYFKPDAGKLLLSPADESPDTPRDVFPDQLDIAIGVDRVQTALDIEVRRISHSWAGLRTFVPDRNSVVGFDSELPAFFWCAGQGGYGIQTAPALARVAAALATSRALPEDVLHEGLRIDSLSPARFRQTSSGVAEKIAASS